MVNKNNFVSLIACSLVGALLVSISGCSGGGGTDAMVAEANKTNVQRLANLYQLYQSKNQWQGPEDLSGFKSFVSEVDQRVLKRAGVESVDAVFASERDGEPFTIRFGVPGSSRGSTEPVIFEKTGKDGMRRVGFLTGMYEEVDDSRYQKLLAGQGTNAPANSRGATPFNR